MAHLQRSILMYVQPIHALSSKPVRLFVFLTQARSKYWTRELSRTHHYFLLIATPHAITVPSDQCTHSRISLPLLYVALDVSLLELLEQPLWSTRRAVRLVHQLQHTTRRLREMSASEATREQDRTATAAAQYR